MIGKAKSISHGINDLRYIMGESSNKKSPEKIFFVKNNLLDEALDASGIWDYMKLMMMDHPRVKNSLIRIEISPPRKYTKDFSIEDWAKLWDDFVEEFDKLELRDKRYKHVSSRTNLKNSAATVWLHLDSKSGIPHLHAAVCRADMDGNINNDHFIHERAQKAAESVALKRWWETAAYIHKWNVKQIISDCEDVLSRMDKWDVETYLSMLSEKYDVNVRRDSSGVPHGYSIKLGNSIYKASELGVERDFTISSLHWKWNQVNGKITWFRDLDKPSNTSQRQETHVVAHPVAPLVEETKYEAEPLLKEPKQDGMFQRDYSTYSDGTVAYDVHHEGDTHRFYIPKHVYDYFDDEFDSRMLQNWEELTNLAISVFVGLLGTPNVQISAGGGGSSDLPWRKKDEDDIKWARRCAWYAKNKLGTERKRTERKGTERKWGMRR